MKRFKVLEREPDESRMDAALYQAGRDSSYAEVYQSAVDAHDAAPSDLTEAVEALVREVREAALVANTSAWVAAQQRLEQRFAKLRAVAPEFVKQAMEGGDAE